MLLRGLGPGFMVETGSALTESITVRRAFLFGIRKESPRATECSKKFLRMFYAGFHAAQGSMATWLIACS